MNMTLFISLLFILQIFYWTIGRKSSKNIKGQEDYFLAGKSVRLFPLMMTFVATQVGGGVVLGASEEAYQYGWPVLLYPLGAALGMIVLGSGIGSKLARFQLSTVSQLFEVVYQSPLLKKFSSVLSILSLFMILVAQIVAFSKFLASIGFDNTPLFLLFWGIVILYTVQGGLKAVISTDIAQAIIFSVIFLLCFGFSIYTNPATDVLQWPLWDNMALISSKLTGWLLMPLLFIVIEQDMGQRCFAGKSPQIVSKASLLAGLLILNVCIVPVYFGTMAKSMGLVIPEGSSVLMTTIIATMHPWISALVGCAVLAAIISTVTSLINAISSNISYDFFKQENSLRIVQRFTFTIAAFALLWAFFFNNIVDLLIQSYELSVSCQFISILFALFKKEGRFSAAFTSILFGAAGFIFFRVFPIEFPKEIASLFLSLLGYGCGELFAKLQMPKAVKI